MRSYSLSRRLLSLTLALLVLAASIGLPVQRRTCRLSGRSTARIAWQAAEFGQLGHSWRGSIFPVLTGSCYAYSLELHQLNISAPEAASHKLVPAPAGPLVLLPPAFLLNKPEFKPIVLAGRAAPRAFPTPLPRPGGRTLLVRLGVLVV